MKYALSKTSQEGAIIDSTPVLRDMIDTFEVSFLMPGAGTFIAIFSGDDGVEHKEFIKNGAVKIPKPIMAKEQSVRLTVCQINGEKMLRSWECWGLKVGAFAHMRKKHWQLSAAEKDLLSRVGEIEGEISAIKASVAELADGIKQGFKTYTEALASLNNSIGALQALSDNQKILQENIKHLSSTVESLK